LVEALTPAMEHEHFAKGLTETVLITLWVVRTKNFLQCTIPITAAILSGLPGMAVDGVPVEDGGVCCVVVRVKSDGSRV